MKKIILFVLIALLFVSCEQVPPEGQPADNLVMGDTYDREVVFLFAKDGVSVYRFKDQGEYRYFTIGSGSFQPQIQKETHMVGKTTVTKRWSDGAESR